MLLATPAVSSSRNRWLGKILHSLLILALIFGPISILLPQSVQAASPSNTRQNGECTAPLRQTNKALFLPLVASSSSQTLAEATAMSAIATVPAVRQLGYEVGKVYTYLYDYEVRMQSRSRDTAGENTSGNRVSRVNAYADLTVLSKAADGTVEAQITMRDSFICDAAGDGEQIVEDDAAFLALLATPLRFKQAASGVMVEVLAVAEMPPFITNIQKGLLNSLQVTLQDNANSYDVEEQGGQGVYNVSYTLEDKADGLHIAKRIITDDYKNLVNKGANSESLTLQTTIRMLLGKERGVITAVDITEAHESADGTQDPPNTGVEGIDGVSVWTSAQTTGSLRLLAVAATDVQAAALPRSSYRVDSMVGNLEEDYAAQNGLDIADYDLNAELTALLAAPQGAEKFALLLALSDADTGATVVNAIGQRLRIEAGNETAANVLIDLLSAIGTPAAQQFLIEALNGTSAQAANIAATMTVTSQEQALIGLMVLADPITGTVSAIQTLANNSSSPLQAQAIGALGAVADNLRDTNPEQAASLAATLTTHLTSAGSEDTVLLYLDAVGNAGDQASLASITKLITDTLQLGSGEFLTDTLNIQLAAYDALRKIEDDQVEGLLLSPFGNRDENPAIRELIANVLLDRDINPTTALSANALSALSAYATEMTGGGAVQSAGTDAIEAYRWWRWGKSFGNSYAGVDLPGYLYVASPPHSNPYGGGLYMYGYQRADAHIWKVLNNYTLAKGELWSKKVGNNQEFGARLSVLGDRIRKEYIQTLPCAVSRSDTLLKRSYEIFSVSKTILVFGVLPVTFKASATGYFEMTYTYNATVCNPLAANMRAGITPYVWATANGSGYVTLVAVRGGGTLSATLLKTSLPSFVTAAVQNGGFSVCIDVDVNTQPLALRFYFWADHFTKDGKWWEVWKGWSWKRWQEWTVATYDTGTRSYNLWDHCY